jgi:F-box domain
MTLIINNAQTCNRSLFYATGDNISEQQKTVLRLPHLLMEIFNHLNLQDHAVCRLVSKMWAFHVLNPATNIMNVQIKKVFDSAIKLAKEFRENQLLGALEGIKEVRVPNDDKIFVQIAGLSKLFTANENSLQKTVIALCASKRLDEAFSIFKELTCYYDKNKFWSKFKNPCKNVFENLCKNKLYDSSIQLADKITDNEVKNFAFKYIIQGLCNDNYLIIFLGSRCTCL